MHNVEAVKSAARAAIVIPAVFAVANEVIKQPQTSIVAAFGSFALLVLTDFAGPWRTRLAAYVGLACTGAAMITLGTLCSRTAWLGALAMAVVGFTVLFAGSLSGYLAAGSTGAMLTFVLPVTIPAANSAIPDRLEGWGLACAACITASMLLWPPRRHADLQRATATALRAAADLAEPNGGDSEERASRAREAVDGVRRRFLGPQHRPTGPADPTAALASLPDELDWLLSFLSPSAGLPPLRPRDEADAEGLEAIAGVLRASADRLDERGGRPDLPRLERASEDVARALVRRLPELAAEATDDERLAAIQTPFRIRVAAYSTGEVARYALRATGADATGREAEAVAVRATAQERLEAVEQLTLEHADVRSVWFRNSIRGGVGLALAVYVAERSGLQHGFWVVLGTLSVLRSNALSTGWSIVTALAGTAAGIVVGALIVIGIGTHEPVLWAVLAPAIFLGAYAPRAISFAAGQAAFTVVLFVLFNIIQPVGWRVGLVRVEDVAIGFAISLGVGILLWPRGAAALLRRDLASAYERAVDSVVATARQLIGAGEPEAAETAAREADAAVHRLDDAFRQYLTERSATRMPVESVAALIGSARRVRRAAQSLASLAQMTDGGRGLAACGRNLDRELHGLQSWYIALGYAIANERPLPPPHIRDLDGRTQFLACAAEAARSPDRVTMRGGIVLLFTGLHLDNLWRLEAHVAGDAPAAR